MKKITQKQFKGVKTEVCVEIWSCSRVRTCGWKGIYSQLGEKRISKIQSDCICPRCGNDVFNTEYMPVYEYKDKYIEK